MRAYKEQILGSRPAGYVEKIVFDELDSVETTFLYNWLKLHHRKPRIANVGEITIEDSEINRKLVTTIMGLSLPTHCFFWNS